MVQQSRERADVAGVEYSVLVGEGGDGVFDTKPDRVPPARLEAGDKEVIEVDQDADGGRVDDYER